MREGSTSCSQADKRYMGSGRLPRMKQLRLGLIKGTLRNKELPRGKWAEV